MAVRVADPVLMAAADFTAAQACMAGGMVNQAARSWSLACAAAAGVAGQPGDDAMVWYGMSHLQAALSAAALGRPGDADQHLAEAADVAASSPVDFWLQDFTPANVQIWRLAVALETRDGDIALAALDSVDQSGLRTRQRRARFHGDAARAYFLANRIDDAIIAVNTAILISPTDVRSRPVIREIAAQIVLSGHRHPRLHTVVAGLGIDPLGLAGV